MIKRANERSCASTSPSGGRQVQRHHRGRHGHIEAQETVEHFHPSRCRRISSADAWSIGARRAQGLSIFDRFGGNLDRGCIGNHVGGQARSSEFCARRMQRGEDRGGMRGHLASHSGQESL